MGVFIAVCLVITIGKLTLCQLESPSNTDPSFNSDKTQKAENYNFDSITHFEEHDYPIKISGRIVNKPEDNLNSSTQKSFGKRSDHENFRNVHPLKLSTKIDNYWIKAPVNYTNRNDNIRKYDHSLSWPTWTTSSKKEVYNNKNRWNKKYADTFEDFLGLDSKHHELSDRKYIHEHEGFFFPIHVPSHHEKDDHLIPLLLLILIPLLLFAIIIPLNANLLSTLFLIMQTNGATVTGAHLAAATGRRRRDLSLSAHPLIEERVMEMLTKLDKLVEL